MAILRRGEEHDDWILQRATICAHCTYSDPDITNHPGPFVFWMGLAGHPDSVDLVFHPMCAAAWAAHLVTDATIAKMEFHRQMERRP